MRRLLVVAVLVAALVGLASLDAAHHATGVGIDADDTLALPSLVNQSGTLSSTWYCPLGPTAVAGATPGQLSLVLANSTAHAVHATITPWPAGNGTDAPPAAAPAGELDLAAHSSRVVSGPQLGADPGGALVEVAGGGVSVAERVAGPNGVDQGPCATSASTSWYFPSVSTLAAGDQARLYVMNPFPGDASVDVQVSSADGVRTPSKFSGIVVPGRTSRVIDLGTEVQRRDQFAVALTARSGRVVAGLLETTDGTKQVEGVRAQLGLPTLSARRVFADGVVGEHVTEQYVVYNPGSTDARAAVSVIPAQGDPSTWPEPFVVDVTAGGYTTLELDTESRVPPDQPHWVSVESIAGPPLATARVVRVNGDAPVLALKAGTASSGGSGVAATDWVVADVPRTEVPSNLVIVNPSSSIAVVTLRSFAKGTSAPVVTRTRLELQPDASVTVDLADVAGLSPVGLEVTANAPIVVEQRATDPAARDLWISGAVPVAGTTSPLPSLLGVSSTTTTAAPAPAPTAGSSGTRSSTTAAPTTATTAVPTTAAPTTAATG